MIADQKKLKDMQAMGFECRESCSDVDNKKYKRMLEAGEELPEGIFPDKAGGFERCGKDYYTQYTFRDYLLVKQVALLTTIKKMVAFIAILMGAGVTIGFLVAFWSFV